MTSSPSTQFQKMLRKPRTVALSSRIDARTLASLDSFWKSQGQIPRSTSELVRVSLEYFSELLQFKQLALHFPTQEKALEYLDKTSLTFEVQTAKMHSELIGEDISEEILRRIEEGKHSSSSSSPPNLSLPSSHPAVEEAARILQQKLEEAEK